MTDQRIQRPRRAGTPFMCLLLGPVLLAASAASAAPQVFRHPALGFELTYPDGYAVTPRDNGVTVQTIADLQAAQAAGNPGATPRALDILFYDNPQGLSPLDWARQNDNLSNWSANPSGKYEFIQFVGRRGMIYTWCTGVCGDALLFNSGDGRSLVYINTSYSDPNDPARGQFKRIATTFRDTQPVVQPTPPPAQTGPAPGEAWLYADCGFGGRVKRINADTPWLGDDFNDQLSAVRLGPGTAITLYADGNFGGRALTLDRDEACLDNRGFNDVASSARIRTGQPAVPTAGPAPGEAWLYEDCGFGGRVLRINADTPWVGEDFKHQLSAVRLGPGTAATLYEHGQYRGRSLTLDRDEACLDNRGFNDLVSSVQLRSGQPAAPASGPAPGEAWLYEDCDFGGKVLKVTADMPDLERQFDDQVSAVRLGPGTTLTLFEHRGYHGRSLKLEQDESCLENQDFDELASSVRIRGGQAGGTVDGPAAGEVWLYEDCNFSGRVLQVTQDTATLDDDFDDQISSVKLGPDTRVMLYKNSNYRGRAVTLDQDEACLEGRHFNDVTSSIRIKARRHR